MTIHSLPNTMLMRKTPSPFLSTTFFALLAGGVSNAAVIQIAVEADTYIRNDAAGPNTINDGDADNEIIIGVNGSSTAELRGLLRFDLAPLLGMGWHHQQRDPDRHHAHRGPRRAECDPVHPDPRCF